MKDFIKRFTSRKFLVTVSAMLAAAADNQWHVFIIAALGYLGSEGLGDAVGRYSDAKYQRVLKDARMLAADLTAPDDDEVDKTVITPGVIQTP
jgi:hypothetical protein